MRRILLLATLFALLGALARGQSTRAASPEWSDCGDGFECAYLTVPLDYADPAKGTIELSLIRLPAEGGRRIGSLVVNPGGPGGRGVEFVRGWASTLDERLLRRFDIVGFDPRGVGESSPISCHDTLPRLAAADPSPDSEAEFTVLATLSRQLADDCARLYGDILPFLGTRNVARDLDRIREALGDAGLTYLGYSYGTEIGQTYADLFPANIRAMVLDGAVDLSLDPDDRTLAQAAGFERALEAFAQDCRDTLCSLTRRGDPMAAIEELLAKSEAAPIPARRATRPAGPAETLLGIITPLYSRDAWPALARAIDQGLSGDGTQLVQLADQYLERLPGGDYTNSTETNLAVNCIDSPPSRLPTTWAAYPAAAQRFAATAPHFGPASALGLNCLGWGAVPDPITPTAARGAPPILVVSTTGDPATPYEWGVAVARQLSTGVLLTYEGDGHTAYGGEDRCVDNVVDSYFIQLSVPSQGARCPSGAEELDDEPRFAGEDSPGGNTAVVRSFFGVVMLVAGAAALLAFARIAPR